jgi:two-component system, LuxR family, response regulator FixJ
MTQVPILIVDDDPDVRDSLRALLESSGYPVRDFASAAMVLADPKIAEAACLIADIRMPDMDGLQLQEELRRRQVPIPVIVVTGHGDVALAVRAMKAGAIDFIEKPFDGDALLESVKKSLDLSRQNRGQIAEAQAAGYHIALLTARERQVLEQLVAGRSNKIIAYELDISPRTVEIHRAHLMEKMQARSLSDVIRMALAAGIAPAPKKA